MQPAKSIRADERRAFRVDEFCEAYRVSRATVYKLMKAGKLRTVLIAGRRVIPVEAAEALLLPTPAAPQIKRKEVGR
ncbi:MAG: helix-turn-helix domain-containing protein [Methylocystis silviterrae]|uniref:helix-turn-helix domain-containing protein n=1 Tax=Methylocystis silviterrae TaxID=2743612 RepID=UPI003C755CEE